MSLTWPLAARFTAERGRLASMRLTARDWWFIALGLIWLVLFRSRLYELVLLALGDERYTHIIVVPLISLGLVAINSRRVFLQPRYDLGAGISVPLVAITIVFVSEGQALFPQSSRYIAVFAMLLAGTGLFFDLAPKS